MGEPDPHAALGCMISFGCGSMRRRFLLPVVLAPLIPVYSFAVPQTPSSPQPASDSMSRPITWTEADKKIMLAKAEPGDRGAQFWLGAAYKQGWFGKVDFREALRWLSKAAKRGDPDAQNALGQMYEDADGVPQNYVMAAKWYRKAAEHVPDLGGASQGRNNLGLLYLDGLGVPKDYIRAYMWFSLTNFSSSLSSAKAQMTSAEILEAERMAARWKSQHRVR